jgi:hypothetical protein
MSENEHYEEATALLSDNPGQYEIEKSKAVATLALAYEQRTANLIALAQMEHRNADSIGFHADYDSATIHERLGL